tara:strand:- start:65 stop:409 length:345 start_codon:yes stop_codon:yes gene_type:complete
MKKRDRVPKDAKYIRFPSLQDLETNLMIKLNFDDVTKFFFFNEYIKAYLTEDEDLMPFINKIKEKSMLARKFRLKSAKELRKREKRIVDKFGLNPSEIEDIFDLIEGEENENMR